ncbi:MAG: (2Fe-2S)-binding protein [Proteobacteria bacterium]|nr:(2Fe-2S)-binding protein [Pseudomonadota bacterium]
MYVCICNAVTESAIREAAAEGVCSMAELERRTGCAGSCGCCAEMAAQVLHESLAQQAPLLAIAA